jgi:hypothetical protein
MPHVVAEEQGVGDILHGQAFRDCDPLYQVGEHPGEVHHKIFEPLGTPKHSYSGDYLAYSGVVALRVMHLGFHSPGHRRAVVPSGGGQRCSSAAPHYGRTFRPCRGRDGLSLRR